jgi:hypothetical protein
MSSSSRAKKKAMAAAAPTFAERIQHEDLRDTVILLPAPGEVAAIGEVPRFLTHLEAQIGRCESNASMLIERLKEVTSEQEMPDPATAQTGEARALSLAGQRIQLLSRQAGALAHSLETLCGRLQV